MHVYEKANFHLHMDRKTCRKWLVRLSTKAPATSNKWPSYVRGYHLYKSDWLSTVARETPRLTTDLNNRQDPFAVAVIKYGCVMEHIPRTISQTVSLFLLGKYSSVRFCEVTGVILNHATGFDLEIWSVRQFYGHQAYIKRLKNILLQHGTVLHGCF